ncbi:RimJ/RimL family protein N-acetyltransferase [Nocardioides albertanoniae]|uniref:RimJ/RimL family protein N-acetyltransferase n=1 Tax=Nocardioides albertanoniae TaxID=1175486 RepID=A0A543AAN3_9ACTN|nr:GNAT family N-acetyltransferase [Nocardioides albertanoniae]TQL69570.1 RimJ/RimL family protein N-acetyltransferase [Nocardioides albertanoniae]
MSDRLDVRLAGPEDTDLLAALRRAWSEEIAKHTIDDPGFEDRFGEWLIEEQRRVWVGYVDGEPAGMVNLLVFTRMPKPGSAQSRWGYLANFYVRREHRNGGLGTAMLEALTGHADDEGFVRIVLSPSEKSIPFYARAGFREAYDLMIRPQPTGRTQRRQSGWGA